MTASLSGVFSLQEFTDGGLSGVGYRLYTYVTGTTTFKTAYTDVAGTVPQTYTADGLGGQYIALNARGELPAPLFLAAGAYDITLKRADGSTVWTRYAIGGDDAANNLYTSLKASLADTSDATKGSGSMGFGFQLNYAVNTIGWAVKNALGANPLWFGAKGDGVRDDSVEVQAAMNFSKTCSLPGGFVFLCKSGLFMNQGQQVMLGDGLSSEIRFQLTAPGPGLTTSGTSGQQQILGVLLNGVSNVTKTVSVGSAQLTMANGYVYNYTPTGHVVWQEDEINPTRFVFGLTLQNMILQGPGPGATLPTWANLNTYGLRTGLNSQTTRVIGGAITNCSTLIWVNGATSQLLIQGPILENCADTEQGILIDRPGSGMPCYEISILSTYFEQAHRCIVVGDCDPSGLTIRGCIANRNTLSSKATSYFYLAQGGTLASTQNISIDENYAADYGVFLGLANVYGSQIVSCKGNSTPGVISYSSGTFANNAYEIRNVSPCFGYVVEGGGTTINAGGAVVSLAAQRIELKNGTVSVQAPLKTRDQIAKIEFFTIPNGGNSVTVNLVELPLTSSGAPNTVGTVATGAAGTYVLNVPNGYAVKDGVTYILQAVANNVGTSSYVYAYKVYIYK